MMKVVIHDLEKETWDALGIVPKDAIIYNHSKIKKCIGCFGCWVKTPGQCVIKDEYQEMGSILGKADELIIISKCTFGGFSSFVKNVLDRSISYILPYFEIRNKEMHHKARYKNNMKLTVVMYGEDITDMEKNTAKELTAANALNFMGTVEQVSFIHDIEQLKEATTW